MLVSYRVLYMQGYTALPCESGSYKDTDPRTIVSLSVVIVVYIVCVLCMQGLYSMLGTPLRLPWFHSSYFGNHCQEPIRVVGSFHFIRSEAVALRCF